MDDTINEKSINKRFNAKESNYKTSAPIIGNSLESRIFASRHDINEIKDLLTSNNIDLLTLNEEYIKSFNELFTQYKSMNEELKDIIEDFKNNIEYKKFSAEDSPFIFDKEFFEKWGLSEDKTKFTLSNLPNEFLNKEIEFEFKVKNVGFYCRKNINNYIIFNNINYIIKYYINDEEVSSFVKEYRKEDYEEEISFKVVFLITRITSEDNYINIDYNFFKQFATYNDDSKFYLTFNKLTDFFDINISEEDKNILSYSDENRQIIFRSGYENKTYEGIEDVIEEKDENINISGNQISSSYNSSSSIEEKTMDLQNNIDDEKIIGIKKHPLIESEEVEDGIEIKGNENNEDITLLVKDRIINSNLSFINMPNYVGRIEDQTDSSISENNSDEFLKKLEIRNTSFIDTIKEKFPLYSSTKNTYKPINLLLPSTITNMNNGGGEKSTKSENNTSQIDETSIINLKDYMEVQEFNEFTRLIIKDPKYFNYYTFGISSKLTNFNRDGYCIDVKGNNRVYFTNYDGDCNEDGKKYTIYNNDKNYITINHIDYLQFPVERPVTSEYIQNNGYSDLSDFIRNSSYWNLLSDSERDAYNNEFQSKEPSMTEEERAEFLMELYNKYEVDNRAIIDIYEEDHPISNNKTRPFYYDKIEKVKIKFRFVYDASTNKNEFVKYFDNYKDSFYISRGNNSTPIGFEITDQLQEAEIDFSDFINQQADNNSSVGSKSEKEVFEDNPINSDWYDGFNFGFRGPQNFPYYGIIIEEIKVFIGSSGKMENVFVKNENIGTEEYKMIELNTPRINKLSFNYSKQNQNSEIIESEIEKHLIGENQIHISEGISDDTLNKNEKNEYNILISDTSKEETSFEINIPIKNNKIEFEINPFSANVIDEPIADQPDISDLEKDYPNEKDEEAGEEIDTEPVIDKYMAFYLNDSTVSFLVIDPNSKYKTNDWQIISLLLNENIENKIIVKLFNYNNNYFENISNMPIIRNIYYYNENTNEKIAEESDIEEMKSGLSFINGKIIISNPNVLYDNGSDEKEEFYDNSKSM